MSTNDKNLEKKQTVNVIEGGDGNEFVVLTKMQLNDILTNIETLYTGFNKYKKLFIVSFILSFLNVILLVLLFLRGK